MRAIMFRDGIIRTSVFICAAVIIMGVYGYGAANEKQNKEDLSDNNVNLAMYELMRSCEKICAQLSAEEPDKLILAENVSVAQYAAVGIGADASVFRYINRVRDIVYGNYADISQKEKNLLIECADSLARQLTLALDSSSKDDIIEAIPLIFDNYETYRILASEVSETDEYQMLRTSLKISERDARERVYKIFDKALKLECTETNGSPPLYIFTCDSAYAAFTVQGGYLWDMSAYRETKNINFGVPEARIKLESFISSQGYPRMMLVSEELKNGSITAVLQCTDAQSDSETITCTISLDDGRIKAFNASEYIKSHRLSIGG